ncbi:MAG: hypothetical protein IJ736_13025, partial [Firmicutes bacterium]|nr:hypothetical protein [Bacillota bacterium]
TSIGQGKTLVSPLFMAMVTAAVANGGVMMQPYLLDHSINNFGFSENKTIPQKLAQIIPSDEAAELTDLMKQVVEYGTAEDAAFYVGSKSSDSIISESAISDSAIYDDDNSNVSEHSSKQPISGYVTVAGKTGTAENSSGDDHAWFVAFAPADNPRIAIAVLLENAGKGSKAIPIARNVMQYYFENCY